MKRRQFLTIASSLLFSSFWIGCSQPENTSSDNTSSSESSHSSSSANTSNTTNTNGDEKVIKLGAVLPLTGPVAFSGQETNNAVKLAVKEWNTAKKIPGYRIEYIAEDDASDPKQAVATATRLVGDESVLGVVSHFNSGCLIAASQVYHRAGIMAISPTATNPQVTLQGFPEIARVCSNDNVQGMAASIFIEKKGFKNIAIVHDKTQYGMGLAEVVKKEATSRKLTIQSFDGVNVGDKDFNALLTKIKSAKPDVVYFGGLHEEAAFLIKQMRELGILAPLISDDGVFGQDFIKIAGALAEGAFVSFPSTPLEKLELGSSFLKAYQDEYKTPVVNWGPYGYDAANILLSSMQKAVEDKGPEPLRQKVVKYAKSGDHQGILGNLKFDEKGDPLSQKFSFYEVKNGKFEYIETITKDMPTK